MNMTSEENMQEVTAAQEKDAAEVQAIAEETANLDEETPSVIPQDADHPNYKGNFYRIVQRMGRFKHNPMYKKWNQLMSAFSELMNLPQETRSRILFRGQIIVKSKEALKGFAYEDLRVTWTRNSFAKPVIAPAN